MFSYDNWLYKQAEEYWTPCEPELDRDGEYTKCINCENKDECEAWRELNE